MSLRDRLASRRSKVAVTAAGLGLIAASVVAASYSPLFVARRISVDGANHLSTAQVLAAAGISTGTNVLHLDTDAATAAIEKQPWVARASIQTDPPSAISITITERRPLAVVAPRGEAVASDGVVLPGAPTRGLPEIQPLAGPLSPRGRRSALTVLAAMPAELWRRVATAVATADGWLALELRDGTRVAYGTIEDTAAKVEALRSLLSWADREGEALIRVDVRVPTAPAATLSDGTAAAA